jgi:acyl carrier protein
VFGDLGRSLRMEDCPETIPGWDSVKHIELIVAIEDLCEIELTTAEILQLKSVGAIVQMLRNRGLCLTL